ncbi:restriction endonuclease subunit S [Streptomyces mirabilis]|nr:restriction endonuclease subunit S [Streptomyces mirabilis]
MDGERALPAGWAWATLGDLLHRIEAGKSFTCEPRPAQSDEWGVIKVSAMTWGEFDANENKTVPNGRDFDPTYEISSGDLLVSRANTKAYVGAPVLVGACRPRLLLSDKSLRLVPRDCVSKRWLVHYLRSPAARSYVEAKASGTKDAMRNLSQEALRGMPIALPPLAEQHRIVEALEEQLSRLDAAMRSLDAGQRRARGLSSATLASVLGEIDDVPAKRLGDLLREPLRNGHSAKATTDLSGIRTLNLTAVTQGDFSDANTKLTVADPHRVRDLWLTRSDILVQRSNTPDLVGTTAMYEGPDGWAIFPDLLIRVRVNDEVLPEFVTLVLRSHRGRTYFKSQAKGLAGSMPKIDQAAIEGFTIPVPSIETQERIVAEVRDELERISRISVELDRARKRSTGLRNALLRTAFSGKLVPQNPDDEPARFSLARIAADHAVPGYKRPRKAVIKKLPKVSAPRAAEAAHPAPEPTSAPALAVQQEFDL